ncbi:MAG TPA: winged helix-turn-helix domain-containing protein [Xanthomonadales bacterium]|nr:winged helix-turn-helix domain-containing protein [Xanthomonadales bacterium]
MSGHENDWTYFSNYVHVLVCLADNPRMRLVEVARRVGVTERTAFRIITNLEEAGVLSIIKDGRRNTYLIDLKRHLRHPLESHCTVGQLLRVILSPAAVRKVEKQFERSQLIKN